MAPTNCHTPRSPCVRGAVPRGASSSLWILLSAATLACMPSPGGGSSSPAAEARSGLCAVLRGGGPKRPVDMASKQFPAKMPPRKRGNPGWVTDLAAGSKRDHVCVCPCHDLPFLVHPLLLLSFALCLPYFPFPLSSSLTSKISGWPVTLHLLLTSLPFTIHNSHFPSHSCSFPPSNARAKYNKKTIPPSPSAPPFSYIPRQRPPPPLAGQKDLPVGSGMCLSGLVFIITGVLDSLEREECEALCAR